MNVNRVSLRIVVYLDLMLDHSSLKGNGVRLGMLRS